MLLSIFIHNIPRMVVGDVDFFFPFCRLNAVTVNKLVIAYYTALGLHEYRFISTNKQVFFPDKNTI